MLALSAYAAAALVFHQGVDGDLRRVALSAIIVITIWLLIFARVGLYRRSFAFSVKDEFYYTVAALSLGVLPQMTLFTLAPSISTSRLHLLLTLALSIVTVSSTRAIAHRIRDIAKRGRPRRIAIVGSARRTDLVHDSLNLVEGTKTLRLDVPDVDATVNTPNLTTDSELDSIGWFHAAKEWGCDTLILTEMLPPHIMPHLLEVCARSHIMVAFAPPRVRAHAYSLKLQVDGSQALIVPTQLRACTPSARLLKRLFDVAIATGALLLCWPFMVLIATAIWLESGAPVLYRQQRVGRNGVVFDLLKFRSMRPDAESATGPTLAKIGDTRVTRVGGFLRRTSLDELPQLINVLRGDMSIVGPRPERPMFVEKFRSRLPRYDERHLVRPGMTGWSQVHMKRMLSESDAAEKLEHDLLYVEHWSLFMDISVIFKTGAEFLFHRAG